MFGFLRLTRALLLGLLLLLPHHGTNAGMKNWQDMNLRCEGLCLYFSGSQGYQIDWNSPTPITSQSSYHAKYSPGSAPATSCSPDDDNIPDPQTGQLSCDNMLLGLTDKLGSSGVVSSILKTYDPEQSVYFMDHFLHTRDPTTNPCKTFVYGYAYLTFTNYKIKNNEECRIIVSVQNYIPPNCHLYDRQPLIDRLCAEIQANNTLYRFTIASRFDDYSCDFARNGNRPCNPREFIAISFPKTIEHTNVDPKVLDPKKQNQFSDPIEDLQNPWFACVLGEDHVTSWYGRSYEGLLQDEEKAEPLKHGMRYMFQYGHSKHRLTLTEPYSNGAPGIFWSTVRKVEKENTILCSFIITDRNVQYNPLRQDPDNILAYSTGRPDYFSFGSFGGDAFDAGNGWHVRLAEGLVQRGEDYKRDYVSAYGSANTENELKSKTSKIHDQAITGINFYKFVIVTDKPVLSEKAILAATPVRQPHREDPIPGNARNLLEMDAVYRSCRESKSLCHFIGEETGCITKEKCHFLVSIKADKNWTKLYFDYVYHARVLPGELRLLKPLGWVGLGFSDNRIMGNELVFTCGFTGHHSKDIYITYNTINPRSNLYYPTAPYQTHIKSPYIKYGKIKDENEPRVHCSFYIEMKDFNSVDLGLYRQGKTIEYNLTDLEYTVLLAFGTGRMGHGEIPYHGKDSRKNGPNHEFSKKVYLEKVIA